MKVILLKDVKNVGKKDQTVEVSDGFAKNFLFPRKLAVQLTKRSQEILADQKETARIDEQNKIADAKALKEKLENIEITFHVKVGNEGKLFGSISLKQVEEEMLKQHHITIDKRKFIDKGPLDSLGRYQLRIELYKNVVGNIHISIVQEEKKNGK